MSVWKFIASHESGIAEGVSSVKDVSCACK